jgi:microsomal prostaglandin-E synthase 1
MPGSRRIATALGRLAVRVEARQMIIVQAAPALLAYAIACVVLALNLLVLWVHSGLARARAGTAINPEDAARFGVVLSPMDPPRAARVLRAHANAQAAIYPFLLLGLVFALLGGPARIAAVLFTIFTAARLAHSVSYLLGKQPWRTLSFVIGGLMTIVLTGLVVWRIVLAAASG